MRIGFSADLHFERGGDAGVSQYQKSFGEMCAGMIQRSVDAVVFGGDIFNRWHSFNPRTFRIVADGLEQLIQQGIRVFMLAGNHDYDISGTFPAIMPFSKLGVEVITHPTSKAFSPSGRASDAVWFTFLPWITKGMAKEAGINLKQPTEQINEDIFAHFVKSELDGCREYQQAHKHSYLFFHASIFGADMGAMRCIEAVDFTLYPDRLHEYGYTRIVGGHFHRRQEHKGVHYVGSMERQNFGERDNPTGWMLIDGNEHEFIELKTPLFYCQMNWDFTTDGDFSRALHMIKQCNISDTTSVKFQYRIQRHDPFDRAVLLKAFYDAGAVSVVLEPEYVEEIQSRTEISAEQDFITQFNIWREANPDKDPDGELLALLERERMAGFPAECTKEHISAMVHGGAS